MAASGMVNFGNKYMNPWFMASEDTDVMCAMGEGMAAMAFPLGPNIDPIIPMITLASSMCADEKAKEEELRYIRALRRSDIETAQDARTMRQRWTALAAKRQWFGFKAAVRAFGEPGGTCPKLKHRNEELAYMFGLFGGVQALQADMASGGTVGVTMDVLPKVIRGIQCLDSDEFWGIPDAVVASADIMMAIIDGDKEATSKGYARLDKAAKLGEEKGVRLVQMMQAILYSGQGDEEALKKVIRRHVASKEAVPADPSLNLLDEMATRGIRLISDKLWTQHTGQRTPYGRLGTFWDDTPVVQAGLDIDDLL
ncbi:MAG: hypothetical protein JKY67_06885 [Pseudomonadales bacterium]|nr:hypothetical protein [Pseudomonadales bacterium]